MLPFAWCGPYDRCQRCQRPKRLAMTNPSVFLSYSHDSVAHKAWVRKLAEDLRGQGVDATLDQWNDSSPHCGGGAGSNQQPAASS